MATDVYVNIKDLPEITEINNGEYILVETPTGTHTIDFKNFVLPPDNTVITSVVSSNAAAIGDLNTKVNNLSTTVDTNNNVLSSAIDLNTASLSTLITTLCDKVGLLSPIYIGKCSVKIIGGNINSTNFGSNVILPATNRPEILASDIMVFPANEYASLNPVYVSEYNTSSGLVTLKGDFKTKTITFNEANSAGISKTDTLSSLSARTAQELMGCVSYIETTGNALQDADYFVVVVKNLA